MNKRGRVACLIGGVILIICSLFCFAMNSISDITAVIVLVSGVVILGVVGVAEKT